MKRYVHYLRNKKEQRAMKKLFFLLCLVGVFFLGVLFWWNNTLSAVNPSMNTPTMFVIAKGAGVNQISNELHEAGLIKNPFVFSLYVKLKGIDKKIQAGSFRLLPSMDVDTIAKNLTQGSLDIWITIQEGKRAEEIADILSEKMPNYMPTWRDVINSNEGYLFPDTYLLPRDAGINQIITIMRNNFDSKYASIINNTNLTSEEIVTLASMIERETRHDEDRPLVSSVMHNRLAIGMALQIDATIQYAKGKVGDNWWTPITQAEYRSVQSSYNTYLNPGLPPGPIANPGLKSLEAAANPTDTNYLFYITDKTGVNRYARTNDEHVANIRKYGL